MLDGLKAEKSVLSEKSRLQIYETLRARITATDRSLSKSSIQLK